MSVVRNLKRLRSHLKRNWNIADQWKANEVATTPRGKRVECLVLHPAYSNSIEDTLGISLLYALQLSKENALALIEFAILAEGGTL
jgi:hypothetical protein